VAELNNWPFRADGFYKECVAEGQQQIGRLKQMAVTDR
jgi:hypothetical protein